MCPADAPWCVYMSRRSRLSYFAVFDGHGGARASRYAAENLHHNLAKKFPSGAFDQSTLNFVVKFFLLHQMLFCSEMY